MKKIIHLLFMGHDRNFTNEIINTILTVFENKNQNVFDYMENIKVKRGSLENEIIFSDGKHELIYHIKYFDTDFWNDRIYEKTKHLFKKYQQNHCFLILCIKDDWLNQHPTWLHLKISQTSTVTSSLGIKVKIIIDFEDKIIDNLKEQFFTLIDPHEDLLIEKIAYNYHMLIDFGICSNRSLSNYFEKRECKYPILESTIDRKKIGLQFYDIIQWKANEMNIKSFFETLN